MSEPNSTAKQSAPERIWIQPNESNLSGGGPIWFGPIWFTRKTGDGDIEYARVSGEAGTGEVGWLLEKMHEGQIWYVTVDQLLTWTTDPNKALRLVRREDAEMLSEIVEDCEKIASHEWVPLSNPTAVAGPTEKVHPEDFCHKCGRPNIVWFAPNMIWNKAVRAVGEKEILCPVCFVQLAERAGFTGVWEVSIPVVAGPTTSAIRAAAREWMNTHHASFETLREREDALVAIIARHLGREGRKGIEP